MMNDERIGITISWQAMWSTVGALTSLGQQHHQKTKGLRNVGRTRVHRFGSRRKSLHHARHDFVEIEVDDPAEGITVSINCADAIALAHAILRRYPDLD